MTAISYSTPMTIFEGMKDDSTTAAVLNPIPVPDHCPLFMIYSPKGRAGTYLMNGASTITNEYGAAALDSTTPYYTHQNALMNLVSAQANACYVTRIIPSDAPKAASIRFSIDLLPTTVPVYERGSDGQYLLDPTTGEPIPTSNTISGYNCLWVAEMVPLVNGEDNFGAGAQSVGSQTDPTTVTTSTRYPIFDIKVSSQGAWGNNAAIMLYAPTLTTGGGLDQTILTNNLVYPFRASMLTRATSNATPSLVNTVSGNTYIDFCLKPGTKATSTNAKLYAGDAIVQAYQSLNDPTGIPDTVSTFDTFYTYDNNVATVLGLVYAAELPHIDSFSDFTGAPNEQYLFNLLSGVSSQNSPYHSYQVVQTSTPGNTAITFSNSRQVFALGGGDGTMSGTAFDTAVATQIQRFLDPSDVWQDMVKYPFSDFYDTGFTVPTKKMLPAFIANRPDTYLTLGLHDVIAGTALTAAQESSLAAALLEAVQAYPESVTYGTPAARCMIVGRSGTLTTGTYTTRVPLTFEIGIKAARYMGASTGIWNTANAFGYGDNAVLQYMTNINATWTPVTQRNTDWNNGLVGVEAYDHVRYYIPALRSVYSNATSVLTSYFTSRIGANLEKVGNRAAIAYRGADNLSDAQLTKRVSGLITTQTVNKYDNRVTIVPNVYKTAADTQRGFSYKIQIKCYADPQVTVADLTIDMFRSSDLQTSTTATAATTTATNLG